jgi:23S rRNA (uracil1939-C5)-methyltransferase
LIDAVLAQLPPGRLVDLYAGVGLFGLAWTALGRGTLTAVEGDRQSSADLGSNAEPYSDAVTVAATSVERYATGSFDARDATILVDPPRTGMSKEAATGIVRARASRVVYVSCDVATLARDARRFLDEGYRIRHVEAFDLFPNTAHVETLVTFEWPSSSSTS